MAQFLSFGDGSKGLNIAHILTWQDEIDLAGDPYLYVEWAVQAAEGQVFVGRYFGEERLALLAWLRNNSLSLTNERTPNA